MLTIYTLMVFFLYNKLYYSVDKEEASEERSEGEREDHGDQYERTSHSATGLITNPNPAQRAPSSGEDRANARKVLLLLEMKERRTRTSCMGFNCFFPTISIWQLNNYLKRLTCFIYCIC